MKNENEILEFWFKKLDPADWWKKSTDLDTHIADVFTDTHSAVSRGECYRWRDSAKGRLAEVIVLDQFSRNMFRDHPRSFAYDGMAVVLAQEAVRQSIDQELSNTEKAFMYMPFMHSESLAIHELALKVFSQPGLENNYDFELKHKAIIDRFDRYPHRNKILGRESTAEEIEFLQQPGSSF